VSILPPQKHQPPETTRGRIPDVIATKYYSQAQAKIKTPLCTYVKKKKKKKQLRKFMARGHTIQADKLKRKWVS